MTELVNKLIAYARGEINDGETEEIEALVTRYLDGTLDPAFAALVEQAMERDHAVASIISQASTGRRWFEEVLSSEIQPCLAAPASPELERFVQSLTSDRPTEKSNVIPISTRMAAWFGENPRLAVAASIAVVLFAGGGWGLYGLTDSRFKDEQLARGHIEGQLEEISEDYQRQTLRIAELEDALRQQETKTANGVLAKNFVEQELSKAKRALESERAARSDLDSRMAERQAEQEREAGDLRVALDDVQSSLEQEQALSADREDAAKALEEKLVKSALVISAMRKENADLADQITELEQDGNLRAAFFKEQQRWLADATDLSIELQSELESAVDQVTQLKAERETLRVALEQRKRVPGPDWTVQVADYHSVYARQSPRHLVEVAADESDHIEKWLSEQLGRSLSIPDLSDSGLIFKGARLLAIRGMPVAQLMYLDGNDEPIAICLMRNVKGNAQALELSEHNDLQLIDWKDAAYQYLIVGSTPFATLEALAERLIES